MKLAIFEDEKIELDSLMEYLDSYIEKTNNKLNISSFRSSNEFLKDFSFNKYDAIFLDVYENKTQVGVDIARKAREIDEDVKIVFITTSKDFMLDAFEIEATHYLVKPLTQEKIFEVMHRFREFFKAEEKFLNVQKGKNTGDIQLALKDIYYIETVRNGINIHLKNESLSCRMNISNVENMLEDHRFLRCHQSYIVNLDKVEKITDEAFVLTNGSFVLLRQKEKAAMKKIYYNYKINKLRENNG